MRLKNRIFSAGFSIIEILVVIGILGVLLSVIIPSLKPSVIEAQKRDACNNLRAISAAQLNYKERHSTYYTSAACNANASDDSRMLNMSLKTNLILRF